MGSHFYARPRLAPKWRGMSREGFGLIPILKNLFKFQEETMPVKLIVIRSANLQDMGCL
jgi:hypothetical protein